MKKLFYLLCCIFLSLFLSCETGGGEECRIYLEEDSPNYFTALYVVENPNGEYGDWGSNILDDYEILEPYGWKMYRFSPGSWDIRVEWYIPQDYTGSTSYQETDYLLSDGRGRKYNCDSDGNLYLTYFYFD